MTIEAGALQYSKKLSFGSIPLRYGDAVRKSWRSMGVPAASSSSPTALIGRPRSRPNSGPAVTRAGFTGAVGLALVSRAFGRESVHMLAERKRIVARTRKA